MANRYTHTEAFAHFGTKPRNVQWSWSARNEDTKTVVVTLWQDEFKRKDGRSIFSRDLNDDQVKSRNGFPELMDNLAWARDHCDGHLKVIIAIAKDTAASPRSIKECFPSKMEMTVIDLDVAGAFTVVQDI